ncbi:energy transducer TonB [Autumnicola edwardsiae]|uniref:Energy transducer TonB n=1 Tax=Autumnicola edwardsiae TaxID=3075594 RepID=A0ABU3CY23_9FLAO|nr:energy transducer TonB [Zunongwangia sp. F297]MDT0651273.1 energy transducer TonB [Zunongwangia sp. F297]
MAMLNTKHEKKSLTITVILHVLLILLLLFFGFTYLDPPPESGIAINFGTSEVGSGTEQPTEPVKSAPQTSSPQVTPPEPEIKEEVVTQDIEEAPVIEEKKKKITTPVEAKPVEKPKEKEPPKKPEPKPDASTTSAMNSIFNGPERNGTQTGGEGNDYAAGDKGDPNGDVNASKYYGSGAGLDGDGNYRLGGRKALDKAKVTQDCNESGIVVVRIEVDQSGRVISAAPGRQGTTNSHPCLMNPAKEAALATRFNSDQNAPPRQVGTIVYDFQLSE